MRTKALTTTLLTTALLLAVSIAVAEVPQVINYQGMLTNGGSPVENGDYSLIFTIYDDPDLSEPANIIWQEIHIAVTVENGLFSVLLGAGDHAGYDPLSEAIFDQTTRWLGITIGEYGTDLEINPRTDFTSVPYAFRAETIDGATGGQISGNIHASGTIASGNSITIDGTSNVISSPDMVSLDFDGGTILSGYNGITLNGSYAPNPNIALRIPMNYSSGPSGYKTALSCSSNNYVGGASSGLTSAATSVDNTADAIYASSYSDQYSYGVRAIAYPDTDMGTSGTLTGVSGMARYGAVARGLYGSARDASGTGYGIYATAYDNGTDIAGYFSGDVDITGTLSKGGGAFKIDHPIDPENRYLQHSFVESPDMMNVYNGNTVTDGTGQAVVNLPNYFGALNRDFRYQLTVIGQFAQAIIAEKISGNQFTIHTDKPNIEVSWQITGIRKDPWAVKNRIEVETYKKIEDRGKYLHTEAYDRPIEESIDYKHMIQSEISPSSDEYGRANRDLNR